MPQIGKISFECLRDLFKINKIGDFEKIVQNEIDDFAE